MSTAAEYRRAGANFYVPDYVPDDAQWPPSALDHNYAFRVTLTAEAIEAVAQRCVALLRTTPLAPVAQPDVVMTPDEVQAFLKCKTPSALYRRLAQLGVKPYAQGKYRRADVINAVARAGYRAQQPKAK